ncbi:hypothetical protein [Vibrio hyugaensis]|uniref:hypothetical protein n=1 Tax=Vibrio hyugaensis TaxID=1534743 RepID=UPI000A97E3A1|nr:hypothetical protein [Vibrio hyugaensis]
MKVLDITETEQVNGGGCYTTAFGAVLATGIAVALPSPATGLGAAWSWVTAYESCIQ